MCLERVGEGNSRSAVREFPRAPSHWDNGDDNFAKKTCHGHVFRYAFHGDKEEKKRVASTRTNSVHFETGILRPIGKQGQGCLKILNNLIWNICSRSLSQVFRRNLRLIVLS